MTIPCVFLPPTEQHILILLTLLQTIVMDITKQMACIFLISGLQKYQLFIKSKNKSILFNCLFDCYCLLFIHYAPSLFLAAIAALYVTMSVCLSVCLSVCWSNGRSATSFKVSIKAQIEYTL